ncbi:MAG: DUF4147 domain-containing protein [Gemmataceae bacterium]
MSPTREQAIQIWQAAVAAADPFERVRAFVADPEGPVQRTLADGGGIFVFGGGKAGPAMARAVEAALPEYLDRLLGLLNVPVGSYPPLERLHLWPARPAGSNQPTVEGVQGAEMQLNLAELLHPEDLALCLFSGGGSALLPAPVEGVSLADKQAVTQLLHACGATIEEMNCVRKHLSRYKGGRLGQLLASAGCPVVSLIVSDVIGDPLDVIASGPTAPDSTSFADALEVLARYELTEKSPHSVIQHLRAGAAGQVEETPRTLPETVRNVILCNNQGALRAATTMAESLGYRVLNLGSYLKGETRQVATVLASIVHSIRREGLPMPAPICLLSGGETTVTLSLGHGKGGRNVEFALASLLELRGVADVVVLSGGTDGEDGPTDAAGAVWDAGSFQRMGNLVPTEFLARHDAYHFFDATGDLLRTGLTGTNVMDVRVILVG